MNNAIQSLYKSLFNQESCDVVCPHCKEGYKIAWNSFPKDIEYSVVCPSCKQKFIILVKVEMETKKP